jgi:orotidine-5'-phosphate decarboxylase
MNLVIALDLPSAKENLALIKELQAYDNLWLKVGFRSYIRDGKAFLEAIKTINPTFKIFLDLKLYDIPNTMADAASEIAALGVDMFNIHASAGAKAMQTVMERIKDIPHRPLVLAVTALTSFDEASFKGIYGQDIATKANDFALMSYANGLDGVVCSAFESLAIKALTHSRFLTLSPAIRPFGEKSDDQMRVATLQSAYENRVDFPVIGRPIYQDNNPTKKVEKILETIQTLRG